MNLNRGRIFTITRNPAGTTTEACRDCGWSITYRERATPVQRNDKAAHVCPTDLPQWELLLLDKKVP